MAQDPSSASWLRGHVGGGVVFVRLRRSGGRREVSHTCTTPSALRVVSVFPSALNARFHTAARCGLRGDEILLWRLVSQNVTWPDHPPDASSDPSGESAMLSGRSFNVR